MTIKVLHLIDSGGLYGAEKMLLALVSEQIKQGLEPMILSAAEPDIEHKALETEARRLGLPVIPWRMKPGFNLRDSLAIIRWAQSEGYEVFHSHGYKFNVLIGLWPERIRKIPLMATLHGYVKAPRFTKSWLYESLDRLALRQMRCVVVVAEAMKKDIPRGLAESGRVRVIPNGLDTALLEKAANEPLESELASFFENYEPVVLGVGRLSNEKGFDRLIEAFKAVKDRHADAGLVIIGEGKQRKSLEQGIRKLGLTDSVIMPGYYENVPALMARCDLLCMPSRTEGLPITLLEAMAVGAPLCASDVGEIRNVLGDGQGGMVNSLIELSNLSSDILNCLSAKDRMASAIAWSKQQVDQHYSARKMTSGYHLAYIRVVS